MNDNVMPSSTKVVTLTSSGVWLPPGWSTGAQGRRVSGWGFHQWLPPGVGGAAFFGQTTFEGGFTHERDHCQ